MTRTLNISLNVPDYYAVEYLTRQLTEYGEQLIARRRSPSGEESSFSSRFLKGLRMPEGKSERELVDEYLAEKYTQRGTLAQ